MMKYKGFIGSAEYDNEAKIFHGDVINSEDVITFEGENIKELEKAFHESVDDYLAWCEEEDYEQHYSNENNVHIRKMKSFF